MMIPSHPSCAAFFQRSGSSDESRFWRPTITSTGASRSMKLRAVARSSSWLSVSPRSMGRLSLRPVHGAALLARRPPEADPPRHLHTLDVSRAAGMHGDDAVALLGLEEPGGRAPREVGRQGGRADGVQDRAGHPEAGRLAEVRELRPLVRLRLARVREPEGAKPEEPLDLGLDVDVGQAVAHVLLLAQRHTVALGLLAVAQQPIPHAVAADPAAAAVLELQVCRGDRPALVLAADQAERGHADVVEENRLLDAAVGSALAAGAHQFHRLHADARQLGVDHEPGEILVALALRVGARDQPDAIGAVVAPNEDLLALDDVLVAVTHRRRHPYAGEVGAGAGLGQELPGAHVTAIDRRQKRLALLFRAPHENRRRAQAAAAVIVRGQREVKAIDFLFQDDRVVAAGPAPAVLRGGRRVEPALGAELAAERAELQVALVAVLRGDRRALDARRHVRLEPGPHLAPESLLLLVVREPEGHGFSLAPDVGGEGSIAGREMSRVGWTVFAAVAVAVLATRCAPMMREPFTCE